MKALDFEKELKHVLYGSKKKKQQKPSIKAYKKTTKQPTKITKTPKKNPTKTTKKIQPKTNNQIIQLKEFKMPKSKRKRPEYETELQYIKKQLQDKFLGLKEDLRPMRLEKIGKSIAKKIESQSELEELKQSRLIKKQMKNDESKKAPSIFTENSQRTKARRQKRGASC